jgi:phage/plasmid-like protein (TIGR03299 family)
MLRIVHFDKNQNFKTTEEAVIAAEMDWEIVSRPVLDDETKEAIPNVVNIKRMEKDETKLTHRLSLGLHSNRYEAVQNKSLFKPFDSFLETGKVRIVSAGEMKDGRLLYMQGQIIGKEESSVGGDGQDKVANYITCFNSHDGSKPFGVGNNNTRIVCQNTLMMAIKQSNLVKYVHKKGINEKVDQVVEILSQLTQDWDANMEKAARLRDHKLDAANLEKFMRAFMGVDPLKELKGKTQSSLDKLMDAAMRSPGNSETDVNLWSAYNAISYNLTHIGGKKDNRLYSNLFGEKANQNLSAWRQALEFASLAV